MYGYKDVAVMETTQAGKNEQSSQHFVQIGSESDTGCYDT